MLASDKSQDCFGSNSSIQANQGLYKRQSVLNELKSHRDSLFSELNKITRKIEYLENNPTLCNSIDDYRELI